MSLMLSVYSSSLYEHRKWGIFSVISGYFYYANHIDNSRSAVSIILLRSLKIRIKSTKIGLFMVHELYSVVKEHN